MALQLHRLFSTGGLYGNFSSSSRIPIMLQYRAVQNYTACLPYSPLGNGKECRKCVSLKFRKSSLTDGYSHVGAFTAQSQLGAGFTLTTKIGNIFTYKCLDSGIRLNLPYYECRDRRSFSVRAIQKSQVPRTSMDKNENLVANDGNSGGKYFSFKKFNVYQKRAKSLAARRSSLDGEMQVVVSKQPVKESASNARKTVVRNVDVVNSQEHVGGDCKKDVESGPHVSTSVECSNNNQEPKVQVKKKPKTRSKKHEEQLPGISSPSGAAQTKSSKRASQVKKPSFIKADQSLQASENLSAGETPMAVVDNPASIHHELKKKTGNSTRNSKSQKKATVLMKSEETIPKTGKSAPLVSSSSKLPQAQKLHVQSQKTPFGKRTLRQLYPPIGKSVVVVESATKSKVIQGYLGDMFEVLPSYGHVRDLATKSGSVRPNDDFSMVWEVPSAAWTHLKSIKVALKGAQNLILASDPDREGEAIAWHILEMLEQQDALNKNITVARVVFHEITESSIKSALQAPRDIDANLVHAYLARRALDYLIGFNISPVLWKKFHDCPSAGRVQSAALSLICDREMEIDDFKPQEYWSVEVELKKKEKNSLDKATFPFLSFLTHFDFKKLEQLSISSNAEAKAIEQKIICSDFKVIGSKRSKTRKNPPAPYITSTLQQDAANKLHFTATYTMKLAQKLYEGIKLSDDETIGLITYMRTDGLHVSTEAAKDIHSLVTERYGQDFASESIRKYFKKVKNAQEAHEAIRPTNIRRLPSMLAGIIDEDSLKLYTLIWSRTMACQMEPTVIAQIQLDIGGAGESIVLRSTCSRVEFLGYQAAYKDVEAATVRYNEKEGKAREEVFKFLHTLKSGDSLYLGEVELKQHYTQPPYRYSEGSLVQKMEELGIGRPSTYANTIRVLQERRYMTVKSRVLYPEFRGRIVSAFLSHHFSEVTDYSFTADMETELDNVSAGMTEWKGLLKDYWTRFSMYCDQADAVNTRQVEKMLEETLGDFLFASLPNKSRTCPSCKAGTLSFKLSKHAEGYFIGCDQHPRCKYIAKTIYNDDEDGDMPQKPGAFAEPKCLGVYPGSSEKVLLKNGPYGFYIQLGEDRKGHLPKRANVGARIKDVESITLEVALDLLRYPIELGYHPEDGRPVLLQLSRFGYSVKHRRTIAPVPKNMKPEDVTLEIALKLLSGKDAKQCGRPKGKPKLKETIEAS